MFKFFRQYNKVLLVVGGIMLMVAFLIPQAVTMFAPNQDPTLGTMHGVEVKNSDRQQAAGELQLLAQLTGGLMPTDDEVTWLMIQSDAEALGLWASDAEVTLALETLGLDAERLNAFVQSARGLTVGAVRETMRKFLIAEQYRQLVTGKAYQDPQGKSPSPAIARIQTVSRAMQQAQQMPPQYQQMFFRMALAEAEGPHRLSGAMLRHLVKDNFAGVEGRLALIQPDTASIPEPDEATLQRVFDTYKDVLPATADPAAVSATSGGGRAFAFGYRYPDRVKLEYLRVPAEALREAVKVEYVEVLDAYRKDKERFAAEGQPAPDLPTAEATATLTEELRDRAAAELQDKIVAQVQGILAEDVRGLPLEDSYYTLPADYQPTPLSAIAERVRAAHGVELEVMGSADQWVSVNELRDLEGIGFSGIGDAQPVMFEQYVAGTRQLVDDPLGTPRALRTQVGVGSKPLRGFDGGAYFFRLLDAQRSHAPAGLDEVREQVVRDAKTLAGYEKLVAEKSQWRERVIAEGLDAVAKASGAEVVDVPSFQKNAGIRNEAPVLPKVGASRALVDAAFALVEGDGVAALPSDKEALAALPIERKLAVVEVPAATDGPGLAIFELTGYTPLTRSGYEDQLSRGASLGVSMMLDVSDDPAAEAVAGGDPMSKEALARRVGFELSEEEDAAE